MQTFLCGGLIKIHIYVDYILERAILAFRLKKQCNHWIILEIISGLFWNKKLL